MWFLARDARGCVIDKAQPCLVFSFNASVIELAQTMSDSIAEFEELITLFEDSLYLALEHLPGIRRGIGYNIATCSSNA